MTCGGCAPRSSRCWPIALLLRYGSRTTYVLPLTQPKVHRFVRDKFFPGLGLAYVGCWAWIKLASSGAPLYTLARPQRRKPYELLVLGAADGVAIPPRLLMSVALAHSQKPYVARTSLSSPSAPSRGGRPVGGACCRGRALCAAHAAKRVQGRVAYQCGQ